MRSTFYGLDIASKGLFVAQRQLDVMGHNVANANTEGYSRQRFITAAVPAPGVMGKFAPMSKGQVGHGVETLSLDQIRDRFLDRQYRQEVAKTSYWDTRASALYYVEDVFNGTADTRLDAIISRFFNSAQELTKNPTDQSIRTTLLKSAEHLTTVMHEYHSQLVDLMYQQDYMLTVQADVINQYSKQIAALNDSILRFEQGGQIANDLRDHRNLLLDKLATLVDISYEEMGIGKYSINGRELTTMMVTIGPERDLLIGHTEYIELISEPDSSIDNYVVDSMDSDALHTVRFGEVKDYRPDREPTFTYQDLGLFPDFPSDGDAVIFGGGELKSYLDMRDGINSEDIRDGAVGIPYYIRQLDILAQALVEEFNRVHTEGWTMPYTDADGNDWDSRNGVLFFAVPGDPPEYDAPWITAGNIRLSEDILASVFNIAASGETVLRDEDGHFHTGNNENALRFISDVKERNDIDYIGSFEGFFKSFIAELAAEVSSANQMYSAEAVLTDSIQAQRLSVMSVSLDEEMLDMVRFQHAYNAAARALTTMDEMLEVMINRMGRVGL